jgi:hypothetical protein
MSDLTPAARALVRTAKEREAPLPEQARARVHQSVLRHAATLGAAAAAAGSTGMTAKASALASAVVGPMLTSALFGGLAGAALIVATTSMRRVPDGRALTPPLVGAAAGVRGGASPEPARALAPEPQLLAKKPFSPASAHSAGIVPSGDPREPTGRLPIRVKPASLAVSASPAAPPSLQPIAPVAALTSPAPAGASTSTEPVDDLTAQVELLRQAHAALRASEPKRALDLLDRRGAALRSGPLAEEAGAARISALCQLGRESDARSAIGSFLSSWPRSPLSLKIRGGCPSLIGERR